MNPPNRLSPLLPAVIAFAFGVYARSLSEHPSWDSLRYAASVAADAPGQLASAHHPLGGLIAYGLHRVATLAGVGIEPLRLLQLTSAAFGAIAVAGLCATLRLAGVGAGTATATAAGLGASLAFWTVATDGEVYAVGAAALVAAFWALLRVTPERGGRALVAGAAAALAMLGHHFNAVAVLWTPLWFWRRWHARRPVVSYGAGFALVAAGGYLLAWRISGWGRTPYDFFAWFMRYALAGFHFPQSDPVRGGLQGVVASLMPLPQLGRRVPDGSLPLLVAVVLTLTALLLLCAASWRASRRDRDVRGAGLAALMAVSAMALAAWWEPGTQKFWVPGLTCAWLAIGLGLRSGPAWQARALALTAASLAALNYGAVIQPRSDAATNPLPEAARAIAAVTAPHDLVVVAPNIFGPYLAYYGRRAYVTNLFAVAREARRREETVGERLQRLMSEAAARNGRVFVMSNALTIPPERRLFVPRLPATVENLVAPRALREVLVLHVRAAQWTLYEAIATASGRGESTGLLPSISFTAGPRPVASAQP